MKGLLNLVPAHGASIRDPRNGRFVSGPVEVPDNSFWRRRLRDGSMLVQPPSVPESPVAPAPVQEQRGSYRRKPAPVAEPVVDVTPELLPEE